MRIQESSPSKFSGRLEIDLDLEQKLKDPEQREKTFIPKPPSLKPQEALNIIKEEKSQHE